MSTFQGTQVWLSTKTAEHDVVSICVQSNRARTVRIKPTRTHIPITSCKAHWNVYDFTVLDCTTNVRGNSVCSN